MRIRSAMLLIALSLSAISPSVARAQRGAIDLTADLLERLLRGYDTERSESKNVDAQVADLDTKIKKFRECKAALEAAGEITNSRLGQIAARAIIKAKCGAQSEDDFVKERGKLMEGPEMAAMKAGGFGKIDEYRNLRDKVMSWLRGDKTGFTKAGNDLLASRESALSSKFGIAAVQMGGSGGPAMGGMSMPGVWGMDYAWTFLGQLFAVQYLSGATMFEKEYTAGQWTRWEIVNSSEPNKKEVMERAFLFKTADGTGEWWRLKTIVPGERDGKQIADTVTFEALFKNMGDPSGPTLMKQLVRMRGKLPGNPEAQEMIVPQAFTMLPLSGALGMRPTPESVQGATVGTENVGSFSARHVKFGMGGGNIEWWLADNAPGGWVKFRVASTSGDKSTYEMTMVGQGSGAQSELGIKP